MKVCFDLLPWSCPEPMSNSFRSPTAWLAACCSLSDRCALCRSDWTIWMDSFFFDLAVVNRSSTGDWTGAVNRWTSRWSVGQDGCLALAIRLVLANKSGSPASDARLDRATSLVVSDRSSAHCFDCSSVDCSCSRNSTRTNLKMRT